MPPLPSNDATPAGMPTRNLGSTGCRVGLFSLGGQAAIEKWYNEDRAVPLIERAVDLGVNYIDTAAGYGGPQRWGQRYIGQVMKRRRAQVFLASKTHDRTRDGALKQLEESLRLLNTDYLDLWQIHNVARMDQVERITARGGAVDALVQAREQKMVRFLGVTGHADPGVLIEAIRRFPFDTVLMPVNAADKHHSPSFVETLLPMAVERQMGIIAMKVPAHGRMLFNWRAVVRLTYRNTLTMREAMYYPLSLPVSTVLIGCDSIAQLEENVQLACSFTPLTDAQMKELETRTQALARQVLFYRHWG